MNFRKPPGECTHISGDFRKTMYSLIAADKHFWKRIYTVPKSVWKIFKCRNFPGQHGDSAGSLRKFLFNNIHGRSTLAFGKISLP
jgi:hypothetical protein